MRFLTLCCMLLGAAAETLTLSSPDANAQAGYSAFDFVLGNSYLTATGTKKLVANKTQNLTSITITPAATWYQNRHQGIGIAIYRKSGEHTWTYVGCSDWQKDYQINGKTTLTFTFDQLELNTNDSYTVVFYAKKTAFNILTPESTLSSLLGLKAPTASNPIAVMGMKSVNGATEGFSMYGNNGHGGVTQLPQSPCVTFTTTSPPNTVPLALLIALGGLAALSLLALRILVDRHHR